MVVSYREIPQSIGRNWPDQMHWRFVKPRFQRPLHQALPSQLDHSTHESLLKIQFQAPQLISYSISRRPFPENTRSLRLDRSRKRDSPFFVFCDDRSMNNVRFATQGFFQGFRQRGVSPQSEAPGKLDTRTSKRQRILRGARRNRRPQLVAPTVSRRMNVL